MSADENKVLIDELRSSPTFIGTTLEQWRIEFAEMYSTFPMPKDIFRETVAIGPVSGEWFKPSTSLARKVMLYLHGGGFALGSSTSHAVLIANICNSCGINTLAVNYRLAPEFPYPLPLNDAVQAYHYLLTSGYAAKDIVIIGDSAGAGLTLSTLLKIRDSGDTPQPACAVLLSGLFDLTLSSNSVVEKAGADPLVTRENVAGMVASYAPGRDLKDPYLSPVFASFKGLAPLLVEVGSNEILLDDSIRIAEQAKRDGVNVELNVGYEMVHVWQQYAHRISEAGESFTRIADFIRSNGITR